MRLADISSNQQREISSSPLTKGTGSEEKKYLLYLASMPEVSQRTIHHQLGEREKKDLLLLLGQGGDFEGRDLFLKPLTRNRGEKFNDTPGTADPLGEGENLFHSDFKRREETLGAFSTPCPRVDRNKPPSRSAQ